MSSPAASNGRPTACGYRLPDPPRSTQVLWSQSYDRALSTTNVFDVWADLSAAIAGQLAQVYGVITAAASRAPGRARPQSLLPTIVYNGRLPTDGRLRRMTLPPCPACLEEAVRRDPGYAGA